MKTLVSGDSYARWIARMDKYGVNHYCFSVIASLHRIFVSLLFAGVAFFSAFLLFQIQPMISRMLLPLYGGTSAVWSTCVLFFQTALLGGYLSAYLIDRVLPPFWQRTAYAVLMAGALLALENFSQTGLLRPDSPDAPLRDILQTLISCIGAPYLALSSTSPLLQAWYRRSFPDRVPYQLYRLSNAGSLLALLSYPFCVEPSLGVNAQIRAWSLGFQVLAGMVIILACCWRSSRRQPVTPERHSQERRRDRGHSPGAVLGWIAFPALSSVLLLGFTQHLTYDVSPIPLLWVVPLSLYLLSFITTFREDSRYSRKFYFPVLALCTFFFSGDVFSGAGVSVLTNIIYCFGALWVCCVVCHSEVYRLRPQAEGITQFYLAIAFGSSLGATFATVLAPSLFTNFLEVPLALVALLLVETKLIRAANESIFPGFPERSLFSERLFLCALSTFGFMWFYMHWESGEEYIAHARNFYGSVKVVQNVDVSDPMESARALVHGRILHGTAYLEPSRATIPVSYYGQNSALASVFEVARRKPALRIGIIGLGTGAAGAWGRAADTVRYYEINPLIPELAHKYFSYLEKTPAKKEIVLGDARLSLEREPPQSYDVLVVDAFSSDAIPFHLLTLEAFRLYLTHLAEDGILAIHVSNRHLDLVPVVLSNAHLLHLHAGALSAKDGELSLEVDSQYVLLSRNGAVLELPDAKPRLRKLHSSIVEGPFWTDDFASTMSILRLPKWMRRLFPSTRGGSDPDSPEAYEVVDIADFEQKSAAPRSGARPALWCSDHEILSGKSSLRHATRAPTQREAGPKAPFCDQT